MMSEESLGHVSISHPQPLVAGEFTTARIRYIVGEAGIAVGGKIKIGIPNTGWGEPHVPFPRYWDELLKGKDRMFVPYKRVNTTAELTTRGDGVLYLICQERMFAPDMSATKGYWRWWLTMTVEEDALYPGDEVLLTYGDTAHGEPGIEIQRYADDNLCFLAYVDTTGENRFAEVPGAPMFVSVIAGPPARFNAVAPSIVRPGEAFALRATLTDKCHCRPSSAFVGRVFAYRQRAKSRRRTRKLTERAHNYVRIDGWKLDRPGVSRIVISDDREQIDAQSNPILCAELEPRIFWGDLHGQSEFHVFNAQSRFYHEPGEKGISIGSPDDCYQYARDVACLDFLAITDQGSPLGDGWATIQEKAIGYYEPGQFVSIKAFEAGTDVGHRNVYYRTAEVEPPFNPKTFSQMPDRLYQYFRGRDDVLMIPHHVKVWTNWDYHDPDLEKLVEVYSCWGSSEKLGLDLWEKGMTPGAGVQAGLARGYRPGFVASSDNHVGMPGRSFAGGRQLCTSHKGGLAAVFAESLTREAIFDALRARRCYGTTGSRILLFFHLNDSPMGSEIVLEHADAERRLRVRVVGTDRIRRIDIVKNNEDVFTHWGTSDQEEFEFVDSVPVKDGDYYYVRVRQDGDEAAWASPIWIHLSGPTQAAARAARYRPS